MDTETSQRLRREYFENRLRSAHPLELINMLYEVAIDSLNAAIGHLKTQDRLARSRAITRAEEAVQELLVSLDHSVNAPFTHNLANLYRYCLQRMMEGHANQSEPAFQEALAVLSSLAVAWREIAKRTCEATPAKEPPTEPSEPNAIPTNPYGAYGASAATAASRDWSC